MSKVFLGTSLAELNIGQESLPISRVNLNVDSDTYYTAGDDTGRTIECECSWGTQAMADDILASLRGYIYKPFEGNDALLDPAAELGDTIDVGGFHGVISMLGRNLDHQSAATVGAPGVDEIEDEYPYKSHERRQTDRMLAQTRALITKSVNEIKLSVEKLESENEALTKQFTELSVTLEGVTVTDPDGTTLIKGSSIDTRTLNVENINLTGVISFADLSDGEDWMDTINGKPSTSRVKTLITDELVSSPTIMGGEFYDIEGYGKLELGVYSEDDGLPVLLFTAAETSTDDISQVLENSLFAVYPMNISQSWVGMSVGGENILMVQESNGEKTIRAMGNWVFDDAPATTVVFA